MRFRHSHGERGRPRQRPDCVLGDRGYDAERDPVAVCELVGIVPAAGDAPHRAWERPGTGGAGSSSGHLPGSISFDACACRYDKRADIHEAFLSLGCALICWQSLRRTMEDRLSRSAFSRFPSPGRRLG